MNASKLCYISAYFFTISPENTNAKPHAYEAEKIEVLVGTLENASSTFPNTSTSNGVGSTPSKSIEVLYPLAKLLQNVGKSYEKDKKLLEESKKADEVLEMARRNNIRGASISHFVDTAEDIEMVRKYMGEEVYNMIMKNFDDKMTAAIYLPSRDLVVVFTNKAFDVEDAECSWFHEQTHAVWHKSFTEEERERYGSAVLDYLKDKDFGLYNHIIDKYDSDKYKNEAYSYLIEKVVENTEVTDL